MKNQKFKGALIAMLCVSQQTVFAQEKQVNQAELNQNWVPTTSSSNFSVKGGTGEIEKALVQIIPAPYKIKIQDTIPKTLKITWNSSNNWMAALRDSLEPLGIKVIPKWDENTINIVGEDVPKITAETKATEQANNQTINQPGSQQVNQQANQQSKSSQVTPVSAATPVRTNLKIQTGQRLMPVLKKWLDDRSVILVWSAEGDKPGMIRDVVFEEDFESSYLETSKTLMEVLTPFSLEAEILMSGNQERRIFVRNSK